MSTQAITATATLPRNPGLMDRLKAFRFRRVKLEHEPNTEPERYPEAVGTLPPHQPEQAEGSVQPDFDQGYVRVDLAGIPAVDLDRPPDWARLLASLVDLAGHDLDAEIVRCQQLGKWLYEIGLSVNGHVHTFPIQAHSAMPMAQYLNAALARRRSAHLFREVTDRLDDKHLVVFSNADECQRIEACGHSVIRLPVYAPPLERLAAMLEHEPKSTQLAAEDLVRQFLNDLYKRLRAPRAT